MNNFSYFYSAGGISCVLASHWAVQDTKQHIFLIYAGGVYNTCVYFFSI